MFVMNKLFLKKREAFISKTLKELVALASRWQLIDLALVFENELGHKFAHIVVTQLQLRLLRLQLLVGLLSHPRVHPVLYERQVLVRAPLGHGRRVEAVQLAGADRQQAGIRVEKFHIAAPTRHQRVGRFGRLR